MMHSSIHHDGSSRYVSAPDPKDFRFGDLVKIRLRSGYDANLERVFVRTCPDGEQQFTEMQCAEETRVCRWWETTIRLSMPVTNYRFLLLSEDGALWFNGSGIHMHTPADAEDFRLLADYSQKSWVSESIFYQIVPDRFADGDPTSNVRDGEYTYLGKPSRSRFWGESPSAKWGESHVEFFGGDISGIQQKLDYLASLGVNALYLTPVFTSFSSHKYDVVDQLNVDPHLGGNRSLKSLRRALSERGMHLILDIVPNHCGMMHPWFQAALKDFQADTAEYFIFNRHPEVYECWMGHKSLPKLNYRSSRLRKVMYEGQNSIFRHWLREPYAVDGYRLDVANMLGRHGKDQLGLEVARGIRKAVKEENPSSYLLGENFFDATQYLQGDAWDGVMNYAGFAQPLWGWLAGVNFRQHAEPRKINLAKPLDTRAMIDSWTAYRSGIPWVIAEQQFNLLGSHDTPRILSYLGGDVGRLKLAFSLLMTNVGVPNIFYGDEIGLTGEETSVQRCMIWDPHEWNEDLRAFCKKLIDLRRSSDALLHGGFQVLLVEEDSFAFLRDTDREQLVILAHRGRTSRPASQLQVSHGGIPDGTEMAEIFSNCRSKVSNGMLPIPGMSQGVQIWRTGGR